jgi:hypothetical protein
MCGAVLKTATITHQTDEAALFCFAPPPADIVRSVRETLANYEDPTVMYQLQKELAVKEERFEDAQQFQVRTSRRLSPPTTLHACI